MRSNRKLVVFAVLGLLCLCLLVCLAAIIVIPWCDYFYTPWCPNDDDYAQLLEALGARWDPDDDIPSVTMGREHSDSTPEPWLAIELSFTKNCYDSTEDPCEALADELARIVLEQYAKVDEHGGLQIIITNHDVYGPVVAGSPNAHLGPILLTGSTVDRSANYLVKSLTIDEWRAALSIEPAE